MLFWIGAAIVSVLVTVLLLAGLLRGTGDAPAPAAAEQDLRIYRDQLREVERDEARGVISTTDAERVRTEISRRILEADRTLVSGVTGERALPASARWLGLVIVAALPLGAWFIHDRIGAPGYGDLPLAARLEAASERMATRPAQAEMQARHSAWLAEAGITPGTPEGEEAALIARLRSLLEDNPTDLQGHRLLAMAEARLGDFPAAVQAQRRVIEIQGPKADADDHVALAELMLNATGGYISPEAEAALEAAMLRAPEHPLARFFYGEMFLQNDRPDLAFQVWRHVLSTSDPDAPWVADIRDRIEGIATMAGVRYSLPPQGAPARGPSPEQMADAMDMPEADRAAMIGSMVEALATRLANDGGTAQDWARLIAAYGVLGQRGDAAAIWAEAQTVFGARPEALAVIRAAAEGAGVAQ